MRYFIVLLISLSFFSSCISISRFERGYSIASKNEPVEIPFELEKGLIVLQAEINGVSGRFLFDNGFSLSAISPEFAKKANIQFDKRTSLTDANSTRASVPQTTIDTVNIKGQKFIGTGFYQIDTKNFWSCSKLDGVIGASIINKINWNIDFQNSVINLSSIPFEQKGISFDIMFSNNNSSFTDMVIQGKKIKAKIDFGKSSEIDIRYSHIANLFKGQDVTAKYGTTSLSGNGLGNAQTIHNLSDNVDIELEGNTLPLTGNLTLLENLKYEGYIGTGYFKKYSVIINSSNKTYHLYNPTLSNSSKQKSSYGLTIYPVEENWKVINIDPNDPDIFNIEIMDVITHLDDEPIKRFNDICEYGAYMKKKINAGEEIRIRLAKDDRNYILLYNTVSVVPLK